MCGVLAGTATAMLIMMFVFRDGSGVQVVHFDDVHRVVTQTQTPPGIPNPPDDIQQIATGSTDVTIGPGFTIQNGSPFAVHGVLAVCAVDGKPQEFIWNAKDHVGLPPYSSMRPGTVSYQPDKQTSELLDAEAMSYFLDHHKVTGCRITVIGLSE